MNIALYESHIFWEDKKKNIEKFKENAKYLKNNYELDLISMPEMSFTGFSMDVNKTCDECRETVNEMISIAGFLNTKLSFGWVEKGNNTFYNHYSVVDSKAILLDYIKIHPFSYGGESEFFSGGNSLDVRCTCGFNIGVQICYDLRFPETFRILAHKADLILVPANWPGKRVLHWDIFLKSRAIENQVYIVGINCIGKIGNEEYLGHSCIVGPDGKVVIGKTINLKDGTNVYFFNIENNVESYRKGFPVWNDIREDLYIKLRGE